jgi:hypothetical protein
MPVLSFNKSMRTVFAASVGVALLAQAVLADKVEDAKALVDSFYSNLIRENYPPMINMFMPNATAQYTTKYGFGLPDDVFNFTREEVQAYADIEIPEEYLEYFKDYNELDRSYSILSVQESGETVTITGQAVQSYEMKNYKGQNIQTDTFVVKFPEGVETPLIADYKGVLTFK